MTSLSYYFNKGRQAAETGEYPSRRRTHEVHPTDFIEPGWVRVERGDGVFEFCAETDGSEEVTVPVPDGDAIELARWILAQTGASL